MGRLGRAVPVRARIVVAAVLAATVLPAAAGAAPRALELQLDRALSVPHVSPAASAAFAIDLDTGEAVYSRNASLSLLPASNEKLAVTYAALTALGPSFQIETDVLGEGQQTAAIWQGDLVLKGYGDPTLTPWDLTVLARQVRSAGISRVTGRVLADESWFDARRTAPGWKTSFYIEESPPLRAIVRWMDRTSDNFEAEMLLKQLGAVQAERGTTSAGIGVVSGLLAQAGVPTAGVRMVDGSGLSLLDRFTANALVSLLTVMWNDPGVRPELLASLPVAGRSGTLVHRMRGTAAAGVVLAKTGTTNNASALSGFVGDRYVFSVLQNGWPISWSWARLAQDRFAAVLAAYQ